MVECDTTRLHSSVKDTSHVVKPAPYGEETMKVNPEQHQIKDFHKALVMYLANAQYFGSIMSRRVFSWPRVDSPSASYWN
jgi:hypothetical protein